MNISNLEINMSHTIMIIGGARPNFMKIVPLVAALKKAGLTPYVVNTAQHFDENMAQVFFDEFGLKPSETLSPRRTSTVEQLCDIMTGINTACERIKPDLVVVVGDVTSTLGGALVAHKRGIPLAHVEAGLRSYNRLMPEEGNRVMTDHISDLLFVTMEDGVENLKKEGITKDVHLVGNIMIDTLAMVLPTISSIDKKFYFCTLHRAENVDNPKIFEQILMAMEEISHDAPIYLPLHPRTKKMAEEFGLMKKIESIFTLLPPLSYAESVYYQKNATLVLTDSGGIQEETSYLGVPCLTLRTETERPITVTDGTNTMGGVTYDSIIFSYKQKKLVNSDTSISLWDGKTADRIVSHIQDFLQ